MNKTEIEAAVATAIVSALILCILFFCGMSLSKEDMEEGVMISFGETIEGYGEQQPTPVEATSAAPMPQPSKATEKLLTQDDESVALEQERKRQKAEQLRQEQEQQRLEEQRRAEQALRDKQAQTAKNLASGAFSQSSGTGSGTTTGETMQGNPAGHGNQGGHSWSLSGRSLSGRLVEPSYDKSNEQGTIVVNIRVDSSGRVTEASIATKGTNIGSEVLRKASLEAARSNKFSAGNGIAIGTITYKFVLK